MEKNKFYWIKLRVDFFDDEIIDWLQEQKNGCEYIVLYLRLCLLSANSGGILSRKIGEMIIPYDTGKISEITKFPVDTVMVALNVFKKCGLIYENDNGTFFIPNVPGMMGSESASKDAIRQRLCRQNKKKKDMLKISNVQKIEGGDVIKGSKIIEQKKQDYSEEFERFWEIYPRKRDKGYAFKNFSIRVKNGWKPEQLIEAAKAYRDEVEAEATDEKYIKHASTFLSDKEPFRDYLDIHVNADNEVHLKTYKEIFEER